MRIILFNRKWELNGSVFVVPFRGLERTEMVLWWGSENWKGRERNGVECLSNVNGFNWLYG